MSETEEEVMQPYEESEDVTLYVGDSLKVMQQLPANSVDALVSDPPYG